MTPVLGGRYMASEKSQITNNKSGTLERTGRVILRNPLEQSYSLRLKIIWHASERVKFLENVTGLSVQGDYGEWRAQVQG